MGGYSKSSSRGRNNNNNNNNHNNHNNQNNHSNHNHNNSNNGKTRQTSSMTMGLGLGLGSNENMISIISGQHCNNFEVDAQVEMWYYDSNNRLKSNRGGDSLTGERQINDNNVEWKRFCDGRYIARDSMIIYPCNGVFSNENVLKSKLEKFGSILRVHLWDKDSAHIVFDKQYYVMCFV